MVTIAELFPLNRDCKKQKLVTRSSLRVLHLVCRVTIRCNTQNIKRKQEDMRILCYDWPTATRPLLRQIENLQSSYGNHTQTWERVERNLTERLSKWYRLSHWHSPIDISLFQALCQWRIKKAGGRRVGSGREKGESLEQAILIST